MIATSDQSRSSTLSPQPFLLQTRMLSSFIPTGKMKFSYNVVVVSNSRRLDESGDLNSHEGRCSSSTTRIRHPLKSHQNFDIRFSQKWGKWESPSSSENGNHLRLRQTLSPKIIADRAASCSSQLCTGLDLAPQTRLYLREYLGTE
jgi:hypothetical protein